MNIEIKQKLKFWTKILIKTISILLIIYALLIGLLIAGFTSSEIGKFFGLKKIAQETGKMYTICTDYNPYEMDQFACDLTNNKQIFFILTRVPFIILGMGLIALPMIIIGESYFTLITLKFPSSFLLSYYIIILVTFLFVYKFENKIQIKNIKKEKIKKMLKTYAIFLLIVSIVALYVGLIWYKNLTYPFPFYSDLESVLQELSA